MITLLVTMRAALSSFGGGPAASVAATRACEKARHVIFDLSAKFAEFSVKLRVIGENVETSMVQLNKVLEKVGWDGLFGILLVF